MKFLTILACALTMLIAVSPANAGVGVGQGNRVAIRVESGGWGAAAPEDIATVLESVATELLALFPDKQLSPMVVAFDANGPRVLLEKNAQGEVVVFLSVKDSRWDQMTYQFSHELCHILSNHDHRAVEEHGVARENQWFEEAMCETVSLVSLERMASRWEQSPPYPAWRDYAPAFKEYAARLLQKSHRTLPAGVSLAQWYGQNRESLRSNPYLRDKNEVVATALLTLVERDPQSLSAIGHLNEETAATSQSFAEYLMSWYRCCPPSHQDLVRQIMAMLGVANPDTPRQTFLATASDVTPVSSR